MERNNGVVSIQPVADKPRLYFHTKSEAVDTKGDWYLKFTYPVEEERGLDFEEDLFTPFELTYRLAEGQTAYIVATIEKKGAVNPEDLAARERARRKEFERERDPARQALLISADSFLARRGKDNLTVLAGFPWFTDWGRDTMIALPGLTLTCGRFDVARKILLTFAQYCDKGMIPNVFPDKGETPEYNTVDASLWFVVSAWKYWQASHDDDGARQLLPALADVVKFYKDGTRYDIHADGDGLITAGTPGTQLTWMDVKVDGYVPTPRHGKPVEINALWLNALLMLAEMEENLAQDIHSAVILRKLADQVAANFVKAFWNRDGGYLYDVIRGNEQRRERAAEPDFRGESAVLAVGQDAAEGGARRGDATVVDAVRVADVVAAKTSGFVGSTRATAGSAIALSSGDGLAVVDRAVLRRVCEGERDRQGAAEGNRQDHRAAVASYGGGGIGAAWRRFLTGTSRIVPWAASRRRGA